MTARTRSRCRRCVALGFTLCALAIAAGCGRVNFPVQDGGLPDTLDGSLIDARPGDGATDGSMDGATDARADGAEDARADAGEMDAGEDASMPVDPCSGSETREVYCVPDTTAPLCCEIAAATVYEAIDAIEAAGLPALVIVRSGTYASQQRQIRTPTIFRGYDDGGGRPILTGGTAPIFNIRGNDVTIEGLTLGPVSGGGPGVISMIQDTPATLPDRGDVIIRNNHIDCAIGSGVYVGLATTPTLLRNVHITNNTIGSTPSFTIFMGGVTGVDDVAFTDNCFLAPASRNMEVPFAGVDLTNNYWGAATGPGGPGVNYGGPATTTPFRDACHLPP